MGTVAGRNHSPSTEGEAVSDLRLVVIYGAALEHAVQYSLERRQGGALLAEHQMSQARLGSMARKVETSRAVARRATEYSLTTPAKHPYYTGGSKVTCTELAFEVAMSMAADALTYAVQRRSHQVFVPGSLKYQYRLRGFLGKVIDREFRRIAPQMDSLTKEKVSGGDRFTSAFSVGTPVSRLRILLPRDEP